jgi:four helix bundle protein
MHKNLDVWRKSLTFVTSIYDQTQSFPAEERYGLTNQLRRAAVSIPSNIAEGAARQTNQEFLQFLYIALGSCAEVETQLLISRNLNYYVDPVTLDQLNNIKRMILGLIKKRKNSV